MLIKNHMQTIHSLKSDIILLRNDITQNGIKNEQKIWEFKLHIKY